MKFTVDKKELYVVFKIEEGKLNTLQAPDLKSELVVLNAEGFRNIILDLSSVSFVDSSGLSAILVAHRLCKEHNGTFIVACPQPNVQRLIQISQLESILNVTHSVQEGADYVKMDELERQITED